MTAAEDATIVRHPIWCRNGDEDNRAGDEVGNPNYYDTLAPAAPDTDHVGREYRLEVGTTFDSTVTAWGSQLFEVMNG